MLEKYAFMRTTGKTTGAGPRSFSIVVRCAHSGKSTISSAHIQRAAQINTSAYTLMAGRNRNITLTSLRSSHASTHPAVRSPIARIIIASMIVKYPSPSGSGSFQRLVSPPFSPTFIWRATVLNRATWLTNRLVFPVYRLRSFAIRLGLTRAVVILQTVI